MQFLKRFSSTFLFLIVITSLGLAIGNRQNIYDWYRLRDYTPSTEIKALATDTRMTDYGRKLFYVHNPQIEDQATFNSTCTHFEQTIVLGCYITHRSIHIYDVTDERLSGIKEVTAAHEMLHAAYDRLSDKERSRVDTMLLDFYESIKSENTRLAETVDSYNERDSSIVSNELHSIIPTEIRTLPKELEDYYGQYFTDRSEVVTYAEKYESVFIQQQQRIESLSQQIKQLELELQSKRVELETEGRAIQAESNRLSELRNNNQVEEYNASVPGYNQRVNRYSSRADVFNGDIKRLNSLIEQFNELAVEQKELNSAIDSRSQQSL